MPQGLFSLLASLFEGEVHFITNHLALRVEALEDLRQHIDGLLAAQPCLLGLELFQQVLCGHRLAGQVAAHSILCHLDVTVGSGERKALITQDSLQPSPTCVPTPV